MTEPVLTFKSPEKWRTWLAKNDKLFTGVWLSLRKKGSPQEGLTYPEALDIALCYGWIDGQKKGGDEHFFLQRFTPRAKRSIWSKINCGHIQRLIDAGQMQAAGLAEVERAKADGRWEAAYLPQSRSTMPDDLKAALDAHPKAKAFFAKLSSQNRYAILFRLQLARKPETRARKLEAFVKMLIEEKKFH
jgi:uncharacterized protein YdeI (YjbR/CyaY-like superfamily)